MSTGSQDDREGSTLRAPGPGGLTRERVVAAAIGFVDEHSLTADDARVGQGARRGGDRWVDEVEAGYCSAVSE
jgi:hypothetical protein